jgi:hypothetical protein
MDTSQDPFLDPDFSFKRLERDYFRHGSLVVAVDYDGTLFDLHKLGVNHNLIRTLIRECKELGFKIVIYTAGRAERYDGMEQFLKENNIPFDAINKDISGRIEKFPDFDFSTSKMYYNIFLDDRSGLRAAYEDLRKLVDNIKKGAYN